jgi:serine/threonine protein kinase
MLSSGTILQGRYRIIRQIGCGGMGAVYEALDQRLSRTVALKETRAQTDELRRAFEREARLLANLRHPALPNVIDHFTEGDGQYLVMEFIPGDDLKSLLAKRGQPFSLSEVLRWADELLDALDYLHNHQPPVVHRDIKPSNLKLSAQGRIILLDFGLAKGSAGQMTLVTSSASVAGYTPHYAPLEQIQGERTSPRSDLYALAATLYNLLTDRTPCDALTRATALLNDDPDPLPPLNEINPEVPPAVAAVLGQALSLKPAARPASAAALRAALRNASQRSAHASAEPLTITEATRVRPPVPASPNHPPVPPASPPDQLRPPAAAGAKKGSKLPWLLIGAICFALGVVVLGPVLLYIAHRARQASAKPSPTPTPRPSVPGPYREALASVVAISVEDAQGVPRPVASGFFADEDKVVTSLAALEGAARGRVALVDQGAKYEITGVRNVDRIHGLALLQVSGAKAKPLSIVGQTYTSVGDKVALIGSSPALEGIYAPGTVSGYQQDDGLLEITTSAGNSINGGPVLNNRGELIGVYTGSRQNNRKVNLAAPAALIEDLVKRPPSPTSLAVAGAKEVLSDFRRPVADSSPAVSPDLEQKIISIVFGPHRDGQNDQSADGEEADHLAADRAAGRIQPEIIASATGSFTGPGLQQTAYIIAVNEENAAHADNWGTKRLVIFSGQNMVANLDALYNSDIVRICDLNRDGVNELLLSGADTGQGITERYATLVDLQQRSLRVLRKFELVREDSCASDLKDRGIMAAVIFHTSAAKGSMPEFRIDYYRARCPLDGESEPPLEQYKLISTGELPDR